MPEFSYQYEEIDKIDAESMKNLVGFFELLMEIDKRINPDNYKLPKQKPRDQD